ncbi:MAG TPA: hypothetical protein VNY29_16330 [Terriglobales bacterium]|jgi:hypothetical protein|nr:hypothetical protein [Terriglobales bacterium]
MASDNPYPFWTHDTVAAAVLAGVATASAQSRLDAWAARLNVPTITALVHGWPMVLILVGLILLLVHPAERFVPEATAQGGESRETSHEIRTQA